MKTGKLAALVAAWVVLLLPLGANEKNAAREEGEFKIFVSGKEIGSERYVLLASGDSSSSSSVLIFRNPSDTRQKVHMESKLEMDGQFRPRDYRLTSDVDGKKGSIAATFSSNMAIFEYGSEKPRPKKGVVVGKDYTILDANIFHHFVFLARLFKFDSKEKTQRFEVVIPQEADSGVLKVTELSKETLLVAGKKMETRHLQLDSGSLIINLWADKQHTIHKITVPNLNIEVIRTP